MTDVNIAHETALAEYALPIGTGLSGDQFTITDHLGAGGFGITYRAQDNVLGRTVVIKECFPQDFCVRYDNDVGLRSKSFIKPMRKIVEMFMREARSLARLRHPNIVGVHGAFEENNTAYMVLDLIEGRDLFDILDDKKTKLSPGRVRDILLQLLDAIEKVHDNGLLHRDISPDNILIEKSGTPVLIDFGNARGDASHHTRAVSSLLIVKDGYSPHELYVAGSEQGPCSDLYSLAATFYEVVTNKPPINSQSRLLDVAGQKPDPCPPLVGRIQGYDEGFLRAIDLAMAVHPKDRIQTAAKWRSMITTADAGASERVTSKPTSQDLSLDLEVSLTRLVEETNDEVLRTSQATPEAEPVVGKAHKEPETKPNWVDEFNQESETPTQRDDVDTTFELRRPARPRQRRSRVNWVDRAQEKQEHIRSERENQIEVPAPAETPSQRTPSASPALPDSDVDVSEAPAPATSKSGKLRSFLIFTALMTCFCVLFFYERT